MMTITTLALLLWCPAITALKLQQQATNLDAEKAFEIQGHAMISKAACCEPVERLNAKLAACDVGSTPFRCEGNCAPSDPNYNGRKYIDGPRDCDQCENLASKINAAILKATGKTLGIGCQCKGIRSYSNGWHFGPVHGDLTVLNDLLSGPTPGDGCAPKEQLCGDVVDSGCGHSSWGNNFVGITRQTYLDNRGAFANGAKVTFGGDLYYIDAMNLPGNCNKVTKDGTPLALIYVANVPECVDGTPWYNDRDAGGKCGFGGKLTSQVPAGTKWCVDKPEPTPKPTPAPTFPLPNEEEAAMFNASGMPLPSCHVEKLCHHFCYPLLHCLDGEAADEKCEALKMPMDDVLGQMTGMSGQPLKMFCMGGCMGCPEPVAKIYELYGGWGGFMEHMADYHKKLPKAGGDPHLLNIKGEKFNINRMGSAPLVNIDADGVTHLEVMALIDGVKKCQKKMFITQINGTGSWLEKKVEVSVGGVSDNRAFKVIVDGQEVWSPASRGKELPNTENIVFNHADKFSISELTAKVTPATSPGVEIKMAHDVKMKIVRPLQRPSAPPHLNFDIQGMNKLPDSFKLGGLLGADDHALWSTRDEACGENFASDFREPEGSIASAH